MNGTSYTESLCAVGDIPPMPGIDEIAVTVCINTFTVPVPLPPEDRKVNRKGESLTGPQGSKGCVHPNNNGMLS